MSEYVFYLIPHTHWDLEWYLPAAAFRARLVPVLDDLVTRLQATSAYRSFLLDGQTALIEDYLRIRPERAAEVKALVQSGRLQVGPWYVLADEQIPSGEALIRNLLAGATDAETLGGRLEVLYSPDAFGHPSILPALAREFGIRYAVLWRGVGGEPGQERDLYRWRAPDGSEVVLWHLPPAGYEIGAALPADAERLPDAWRPVRAALVARAATGHIPVFIGADHHAAHPVVPELRDRLAALEPAGAVRVSRLEEFFQAIATRAVSAPVLDGELRWSYRYTWTLQGVHATRAHLKRRNSLVELWLTRYADPLAALARRSAGARAVDRRAVLDVTWRELLRCQFHDAIGGCSSDAVAVSLASRFDELEASAREIVRASLHDLAGHDPDAAREASSESAPALIVWNPAARSRAGIVIADLTFFRRDIVIGPLSSARRARMGPGYHPMALLAADGSVVPAQVLGRRHGQERLDAARHYPDQDEVDVVRVALQAPALPGLALQIWTTRPEESRTAVEGGASVQGRMLTNGFVEVTLQPNGALAVIDRKTRESYLDTFALEDEGDAGDTYTYCPSLNTPTVRNEGPIRVRRLARGPLVAALEGRFRLRDGVDARLVVTLHAHSPIVRLIVDVDNRADDHRLRARLPLRLPGNAALAGTAFGSVTRPAVAVQRADFPLETPVSTAPAHRFVAAARGRRGLALLAPGFFEYEWTARGDVLFTVLRAVGRLSRADLPTRPGHAAWPTPTPLAQCPGTHRIQLGIVPVSSADLEHPDVLERHWEDAFLPLQGFWVRDATADVRAASPTVAVSLEGDGLVFSALKAARVGAGMILRCYNATAREASGAWRFGEGIKTAHRVRADERETTEELPVEDRGRTVRFTAGPREMVTILVT